MSLRSFKVRAKHCHSRHRQWLCRSNWQNKWICLNNQVEKLLSKYTWPHPAEYQITAWKTKILNGILYSSALLICVIACRLNTGWKISPIAQQFLKTFPTAPSYVVPNISMRFKMKDTDSNFHLTTRTVEHWECPSERSAPHSPCIRALDCDRNSEFHKRTSTYFSSIQNGDADI